MFERLVQILRIDIPADAPPPAIADHRLAVAALLVEAANMDHVFEQSERDRIAALLRWRFDMTEEEAETLLVRAIEAAGDAVSLHGFSLAIRTSFSEEERITLIELLWDIAYIDGELHPREASLMREIAGLLYVPDQESGAARKRVLARLGIGAD